MKKTDLLIILVLLMVIFFRWFLPGVRVANDLHLASYDNFQNWTSLPSTWGNDNYVASTMWGWPLSLIIGFFGLLGLPHSLLVQIFGLGTILILGVIGTSKLTNWVGTLLFLTNSFLILLVDGGQIALAMAYSMLPVCVYLYQKTVNNRSIPTIFHFTGSCLALSIFDMRIVYFLLVLILTDIVVNLSLRLSQIKIIMLTALITGLSLIGFHAYWILPSILVRVPSLPNGFDNVSQVSFLSFAKLGHALFLQQPHWPQNVFGRITNLDWKFMPLFILAMLPLWLIPKSKKILYWSFVAIVAVFLAKGNNLPFTQVYPWLFTHIPGFSMFRDPVKLYFLIGLSYSVLIGDLSKYLFDKYTKHHRSISIGFILYILILNFPVMAGTLTGTFSQPRFEYDYVRINKKLELETTWSRTLWIPTKHPLGYTSDLISSIEGQTLQKKRPFTAGTVGLYETMNFIREASSSGKLANILGIKYMIYPQLDPLRDDTNADNQNYHATFSGQLSLLPWIKAQQSFGTVPLYETKVHQDLFFIPQSTFFVVGSDDIYSKFPDLSTTALVFIEEKPETAALVSQLPGSSVILNRKTITDLAASFAKKKDMLFIAEYLKPDPDKTGWWKRDSTEFLWFRNFLQQKYKIDNQDFDYEGGWAISEGEHSINVSLSACANSCILLARTMLSSKGGQIRFEQLNKTVAKLNTKLINPEIVSIKLSGYKEIADSYFPFDRSEFVWKEIGPVDTNTPLTITTHGDINVVNALLVVPLQQWEVYKSKSEELLKESQTKPFTKPELAYTRVSPTHYRVTISNLQQPITLAFSQLHDPLWQISDQQSIQLYGLINGFSISKNGVYDVTFLPQKYVIPGMLISATTVLILLGALTIWKSQS